MLGEKTTNFNGGKNKKKDKGDEKNDDEIFFNPGNNFNG